LPLGLRREEEVKTRVEFGKKKSLTEEGEFQKKGGVHRSSGNSSIKRRGLLSREQFSISEEG